MDNGEHITRREVALIISAVDERARTLEQRLTVRVVVAVVGTNAVVALLQPATAVALGALGLTGYALKKAVVLLFLR